MKGNPYYIPIFFGIPFGGAAPVDTSVVVPDFKLTFHRVSNVLFQCMDCAFCNELWYGTESELSEHACNHVAMARWYMTRIQPHLHPNHQPKA